MRDEIHPSLAAILWHTVVMKLPVLSLKCMMESLQQMTYVATVITTLSLRPPYRSSPSSDPFNLSFTAILYIFFTDLAVEIYMPGVMLPFLTPAPTPQSSPM